ncbi:hypothetical protein EJ07DRAFT_156135 [Lizonia empirigonia]|nr:hypothetical protein EJ07DRAFT_156135 [Lizonia empirigonia]
MNSDIDRLATRLSKTYPPRSEDDNVETRDGEKLKGAKGRNNYPHNDSITSVASSSYTAPPSSSRTLATYLTHYTSILTRDFSSNTLSHAPLPTGVQLLEEFSIRMAEELYNQYCRGYALVLPPVGHPHYPFWLPEHQMNYAIEALLEKDAEGDRERVFA